MGAGRRAAGPGARGLPARSPSAPRRRLGSQAACEAGRSLAPIVAVVVLAGVRHRGARRPARRRERPEDRRCRAPRCWDMGEGCGRGCGRLAACPRGVERRARTPGTSPPPRRRVPAEVAVSPVRAVVCAAGPGPKRARRPAGIWRQLRNRDVGPAPHGAQLVHLALGTDDRCSSEDSSGEEAPSGMTPLGRSVDETTTRTPGTKTQGLGGVARSPSREASCGGSSLGWPRARGPRQRAAPRRSRMHASAPPLCSAPAGSHDRPQPRSGMVTGCWWSTGARRVSEGMTVSARDGRCGPHTWTSMQASRLLLGGAR